MEAVNAVVLHWVANPKTTARANRDFWEMRKHGKIGYGSAHFIVDDTEVVEAIPTDEIAYHVGADEYTRFATEKLSSYPNNCTIGVEMCHPNWSGRYTAAVWSRAVALVGDLLMAHRLSPTHITTHHAITGKECPRWFVTNPSELDRFRWDVEVYMEGGA